MEPHILGASMGRPPVTRLDTTHCSRCKTLYEPAALNAQGHCRRCAEELDEQHPFRSQDAADSITATPPTLDEIKRYDTPPQAGDVAPIVMITEPNAVNLPDNAVLVTNGAAQVGDRVTNIHAKYGYVVELFTDANGLEFALVQMETADLRPGDEYEVRRRSHFAPALLQLFELDDVQAAGPSEIQHTAAPIPQATDVPQQIVAVAPVPPDDTTQTIIETLRRDIAALKGQLADSQNVIELGRCFLMLHGFNGDTMSKALDKAVEGIKQRDEQIADLQRTIQEQTAELTTTRAAKAFLDVVNDTLDKATWIEYPPGVPAQNRVFSLIHQHRIAVQTRDQALQSARQFRLEIRAMRAAALGDPEPADADSVI